MSRQAGSTARWRQATVSLDNHTKTMSVLHVCWADVSGNRCGACWPPMCWRQLYNQLDAHTLTGTSLTVTNADATFNS